MASMVKDDFTKKDTLEKECSDVNISWLLQVTSKFSSFIKKDFFLQNQTLRYLSSGFYNIFHEQNFFENHNLSKIKWLSPLIQTYEKEFDIRYLSLSLSLPKLNYLPLWRHHCCQNPSFKVCAFALGYSRQGLVIAVVLPTFNKEALVLSFEKI